MRIGDPLAHPLPGFTRLRFALWYAKRSESFDVIDRRLDPRDAALLVVHLDRVLAQAMLDPHTLGASLHVTGHFGAQVAMRVAAGRDLSPHEPQHVRAEERVQTMLHQPRIQPGQRAG